MRAAIRKLPDGEYAQRDLERRLRRADRRYGDGHGRRRRNLHRLHRLVAAEPRGINVVLNYTHAYASFAIKAAICPDVPHNEGSFRPGARERAARDDSERLDPAPVASRQMIGHFIPSVIFGGAGPAHAGPADGAGRRSDLAERLARPADPTVHVDACFKCGGTGARPTKGRLERRRLSERRGRRAGGSDREFVAGGHEAAPAPARLGRRGNWRGGLGQLTEFTRRGEGKWSVSSIADRTEYAAPGLLGGRSGRDG